MFLEYVILEIIEGLENKNPKNRVSILAFSDLILVLFGNSSSYLQVTFSTILPQLIWHTYGIVLGNLLWRLIVNGETDSRFRRRKDHPSLTRSFDRKIDADIWIPKTKRSLDVSDTFSKNQIYLKVLNGRLC